MKKFISSIILSIISTIIYGQNFYSEYAINEYLKNNVANLDPIEGKYDVERSILTNSPFANNIHETWVYYVVKSDLPNHFNIYIGSDSEVKFEKHAYMRIESIG